MEAMDEIESYASAYLSDYGFEAEMVKARRRLVGQLIAKEKPRIVVEVGCGAESMATELLGDCETWIVIEPELQFARAAAQRFADEKRVMVYGGTAEELTARMTRILIVSGAQLTICSSVLHEVPNPQAFLAAVLPWSAAGGLVHVNVPNADSFHRQLAVAMGLIDSVKEFSQRNITLAQQRVYDAETLRHEVEGAGLEVVDSGGYLIKPFTHAQMEQVAPLVGPETIDGLWKLGAQHPEWASEIYINARRL